MQPGTRCARVQERARWELLWYIRGRGRGAVLAPKVQEQPGGGSWGPGGQRSTLAAKGWGQQGWGSRVSPNGAGNLPACLGGGWWMCVPWLCGVSPQAPAQLWKGGLKRPQKPRPSSSPEPQPCPVLLPPARGHQAVTGLTGTPHLGTFLVPALLRAAPRGSAPHCGSLPGCMGCRDQGTRRLTPLCPTLGGTRQVSHPRLSSPGFGLRPGAPQPKAQWRSCAEHPGPCPPAHDPDPAWEQPGSGSGKVPSSLSSGLVSFDLVFAQLHGIA